MGRTFTGHEKVGDGAIKTLSTKIVHNKFHRPVSSATAAPVGASLPAKIANDDAYILNECGVLESFASKLAPTDKRRGFILI